MELAPDITAEDLKVFLEEAEEQLELTDREILRLERSLLRLRSRHQTGKRPAPAAV